jgi:hypothetical protein
MGLTALHEVHNNYGRHYRRTWVCNSQQRKISMGKLLAGLGKTTQPDAATTQEVKRSVSLYGWDNG